MIKIQNSKQGLQAYKRLINNLKNSRDVLICPENPAGVQIGIHVPVMGHQHCTFRLLGCGLLVGLGDRRRLRQRWGGRRRPLVHALENIGKQHGWIVVAEALIFAVDVCPEHDIRVTQGHTETAHLDPAVLVDEKNCGHVGILGKSPCARQLEAGIAGFHLVSYDLDELGTGHRGLS